MLAACRLKDVERIYEITLPKLEGKPCSLIVQGLPKCGVEDVFIEVWKRFNTEWSQPNKRNLLFTNLSSYWVGPVRSLVKSLYDEISDADEINNAHSSDESLESMMTRLREKS